MATDFIQSKTVIFSRFQLEVLSDAGDAWSKFTDWIMHPGLYILLIIVCAVIIYYITSFIIKRVVRGMVHCRTNVADPSDEAKKKMVTLGSFIKSIVLVVIIIAALILILTELGVNIAAVLGGLGIAALGISLAMQSMIKDFINGFFIMADEYYRIGDSVLIAGRKGTVEKIDLRKTILRDDNGVVHIIPNSLVDVSSNSTRGFSRINLDISVGYDEDLESVIKIVNEACTNLARDAQWKNRVLNTPYVLRVEDLGDYGVIIKIIGDTKPGAQHAVAGELRLRLKNEFDKRNIKMPYPTQKIYFGSRQESQ